MCDTLHSSVFVLTEYINGAVSDTHNSIRVTIIKESYTIIREETVLYIKHNKQELLHITICTEMTDSKISLDRKLLNGMVKTEISLTSSLKIVKYTFTLCPATAKCCQLYSYPSRDNNEIL